MLRIAYDVVNPILSFHVCTEAEKYFQTPWSSGHHQAVKSEPNAGILLIRPIHTHFHDILIWIDNFSFNKMDLKMLSPKWRPFSHRLNLLNVIM